MADTGKTVALIEALAGGPIADLKSAIEQISQTGIDASDASSGQVPVADGEGAWDWGSAGGVSDVQVNGTSVVSQGVANVPMASLNTPGAVKVDSNFGITIGEGKLIVNGAGSEASVKPGSSNYYPLVPKTQHISAFYGLAKAAGADMKDISSTTVGVYPEAQKSAISDMLHAPETISGSTPSITAKAGVRYICGECSTLSITAPASGCIDVVFESGSTPTVLTLASAKSGVTAIKWAGGFDPTSLDASTTYELNILDGEYGVACSWT